MIKIYMFVFVMLCILMKSGHVETLTMPDKRTIKSSCKYEIIDPEMGTSPEKNLPPGPSGGTSPGMVSTPEVKTPGIQEFDNWRKKYLGSQVNRKVSSSKPYGSVVADWGECKSVLSTNPDVTQVVYKKTDKTCYPMSEKSRYDQDEKGGSNNDFISAQKFSSVAKSPEMGSAPEKKDTIRGSYNADTNECNIGIFQNCSGFPSMNNKGYFDDSKFGGPVMNSNNGTELCNARVNSWKNSCAPKSSSVANLPIGTPIMCTANDVGSGDGAVYRLEAGNKLRHYPNPPIASSWDPDWNTTIKKIDCAGLTRGPSMAGKPKSIETFTQPSSEDVKDVKDVKDVCKPEKPSNMTNRQFEMVTNAPGQSFTTDCIPQRQIFGGNNGSTSCSKFCMGTNKSAWNNNVYAEWKGATCVDMSLRDGTKVTDVSCDDVRGKNVNNEKLCVCERNDKDPWH